MSRFRNTARSLGSGYLAMGSNALYTLASVPLALHYLSKDEFGLWALAAQVATYLILIDFGVSGSVSRILIDYKDNPNAGGYGAVIKTSCLALTIQGFLVVIGGWFLALWLPSLMHIPSEYARTCQILVAVQCAITGVLFPGRILSSTLQAHQRFDAINYSQMCQMGGGLAVQWITFHQGMGVYSLLAASAANSVLGLLFNLSWVLKLKMLPSGKGWGHASWKIFRDVFSFGTDLFLLSFGWQLLSASQIVIISRTLGLTAAAVWTVATKVYPLAFQLVSRVFDYSGSAFSEMVVRGEREGLQRRFRDVLQLTASGAVFVGAGVAVCNSTFLAVWTGKAISWGAQNDVLLGLLLLVTCVTRCHVGLLGPTKDIGGMRYMYFAEGVTFVVASFELSRHWGLTGILSAAIVADILWTGIYGFWRTAKYFETTMHAVLFQWLASAWSYLLLMPLIGGAIWWTAGQLPALPRFVLSAAVFGIAGLPLFWRIGLTPELRQELRGRFGRFVPALTRKGRATLGVY